MFGITNKTYVQFICTGPSRTGLNYVVRASDIKFPSARVYALLQYFIRINLGNLEYNVLLVLYVGFVQVSDNEFLPLSSCLSLRGRDHDSDFEKQYD